MSPYIEQLIKALQLQVHPEGGFYKRIYASVLETQCFDQSKRPLATSIIYLLNGNDYSCLHRIRSDETWMLGEANTAIKLSLLTASGVEEVALSKESPCFTVRPGTWFAAELQEKSAEHYALAYCMVSPGFDFADLELATEADIKKEFPRQLEKVRHLCKN